jgi:cupin fold WbuC family metalloprotein
VKLEFPDGGLRPIDDGLLERARALAVAAERGRAILRFHDHDEPIQRMLNAIEPDSYVRPHRHERPDKTEVFVALAGRAAVCRWSEAGELVETVEIAAGGPRHGVEIPPRVWHGLVALEPGTVLYEVIEGPFSEATHKRHAPWAPAEGGDAGRAFHDALRALIGDVG